MTCDANNKRTYTACACKSQSRVIFLSTHTMGVIPPYTLIPQLFWLSAFMFMQ